MLVLLVFTLLIMLMGALYLTKFELLSPSIILITGFSITSLSSLYVSVESGLTIQLTTYLIITVSIGFFMLGEVSARVSLNSARKVMPQRNCNIGRIKSNYRVPQIFFYLMILVAFVTCIYVFQYTLEAGRLFSKNGSTLELIAASRICAVNPIACESISPTPLFKVGLLLSKSIAYFAVYMLIFNNNSKLTKYSLYLLIFVFCAQLLLSTARTGFIYLTIYSFSIWGFHKYYISPTNKRAAKIIFSKAIKVFIIFFFLFYLLGFVTGKSSITSPVDMFIGYTGLQTFALDQYLNDCTGGCVSIGPETFQGIRSSLYKLGAVNTLYKPNLGFVVLSDGSSANIYTAIRRIVSDFSLVGSFFYFFAIGFFYGVLFKNIRLRSNSNFGFYIVLYSMILFPVFMNAWEEKFSNIIFSSFMIANIFVIYMFFKFFKVPDRGSVNPTPLGG
jgi:oligosaccharide repeat unit polymerase